MYLFEMLGFQVTYDQERRTAHIECSIQEPMLNALGVVHGGMHTYLADTAFGLLTNRFIEGAFVALELKTSFLQKTSEGQMIATARFVKEGRNVAFLACTVESGEGILLSETTGTFYRVQRL